MNIAEDMSSTFAVLIGRLSRLMPLSRLQLIIVRTALLALPPALLLYLHWVGGPSRIKVAQQKCTPFLGNVPQMLRNRHRRYDFFLEMAAKHETWALSFPGLTKRDAIQTTSPEIVEHVLKTAFDNYEKGREFRRSFMPLLGAGIFSSDHAEWRWQRKLASHIFSGQRYRQLIGKVIASDVKRLAEKLDEAAKGGRLIDLQAYFLAFTLDSFGEMAFGMDFNCLDDPMKPPKFSVSFDQTTQIIRHLVSVPFQMIWGTIDGSYKRLKEHTKVINEVAYDCIRYKREGKSPSLAAATVTAHSGVKNLLDLFMEHQQEDVSPLSDEQLRDTVINFILAGRDTTATALSWAFYTMTGRPDIVAKIREEIAPFNGRLPTYDEIFKLKYLQAFFLETLRLYPSVPLEFKQSIKADVLPGGIKIPAGTTVIWSPWVMGRLERLWGPDAKAFMPERWIDEAGNLKRESPFKYNVFNAGPRTCLGQTLAIFEGCSAIAALLDRFDFELDKGAEITYAASPTLPMKNGLPVIVKNRSG